MSAGPAGSDADVPEAGVGELLYRLRTAGSVGEVADTIDLHGWSVPLAVLGLVGFVRGVFEYLTDPFVIAEGYVFPGWPAAFVINVVYGVFVVAFAWFLFFGLIGSFAGYFSAVRAMDTAVLKVGAYLSALFVPVFVVGSALALTLSVPDAVTVLEDPDAVGSITTGTGYVRGTAQMRAVAVLKGVAWIVAGFLSLPVVSYRYELDRGRSVASVLPVTLAAVVATQLV